MDLTALGKIITELSGLSCWLLVADYIAPFLSSTKRVSCSIHWIANSAGFQIWNPSTSPSCLAVLKTGIAPAPAPSPTTSLPQQLIVHQHKRPRYEANNNIAKHGLQIAQAQIPQTVPSNLAGNQIKTGRQKSQAQIDRRRERNRILARRTRLRKKFFFESLQSDVMELQRENLALKEIVRSKIEPTMSKAILAECTAEQNLPDAVLEHCGDPSALGAQDFNLMTSIRQSQQSFVISDPSLQDNPIVYASDDFLKLTGYDRDQVLGRNCRFLQGTDKSIKG